MIATGNGGIFGIVAAVIIGCVLTLGGLPGTRAVDDCAGVPDGNATIVRVSFLSRKSPLPLFCCDCLVGIGL